VHPECVPVRVTDSSPVALGAGRLGAPRRILRSAPRCGSSGRPSGRVVRRPSGRILPVVRHLGRVSSGRSYGRPRRRVVRPLCRRVFAVRPSGGSPAAITANLRRAPGRAAEGSFDAPTGAASEDAASGIHSPRASSTAQPESARALRGRRRVTHLGDAGGGPGGLRGSGPAVSIVSARRSPRRCGSDAPPGRLRARRNLSVRFFLFFFLFFRQRVAARQDKGLTVGG